MKVLLLLLLLWWKKPVGDPVHLLIVLVVTAITGVGGVSVPVVLVPVVLVPVVLVPVVLVPVVLVIFRVRQLVVLPAERPVQRHGEGELDHLEVIQRSKTRMLPPAGRWAHYKYLDQHERDLHAHEGQEVCLQPIGDLLFAALQRDA